MMKFLFCIRTYYFFFSFGLFFLSQSTLNLTYAQDVVVIIDDIESRLNVQGDMGSQSSTFILTDKVKTIYVGKGDQAARGKLLVETRYYLVSYQS